MGQIIRLTEGQLCDLLLEAQSVADNLIDWAEKIYDGINVWLRHDYQRTNWESKVFSYDYEDIYYNECKNNYETFIDAQNTYMGKILYTSIYPL